LNLKVIHSPPEAWVMLAKLLAELGRLREAIETHYEVVKLWPNNFDV
jgi:hypothetical protein